MSKLKWILPAILLMAVPVSAEEVLQPEAETGEAAESVQEGDVIQTDLFSVRIPEEIAEICDIVVDEDSFALYEKISHEAFGGGFAADLRGYKSVMDYCYNPSFERIGEIITPDGDLISLVASYATDVQFDMENEDSVNNYNKILDAFHSEITDSITAAEGSYTPQDETDSTAVFDEVLDLLVQDVLDEKEAMELEEDGFSYLYTYFYGDEEFSLDGIGYAYTDLDYDGFKELVIGKLTDNSLIYDMYTQIDGEVKHAFSSGERDRWTISGGDGYATLKNEASGSAFMNETGFYSLFPGPELFLQTAFVYDAEKDPDNPFFIRYSTGDPEPVSEEEWTTRMGYYGEEITPDFQCLADRG